MKHLLQIHVGPMQTFIAAARRTRDLWFGSWLMSELSKAVARGIAEQNIAEQNKENQLIFPAPGKTNDLKEGTLLGVSNKIVALVADPESAAQAAKYAFDKRFDDLITAAKLQSKLDEAVWPRANKQLHSLLEFYWVSYPINGNYPRARAYADALLASRKNCRDFKPVSWDGAGLPKSSLDGRMETVIPKNASGNARKMYKRYKAKAGEQLSGVDLLKRLGEAEDKEKSRFPSTSHMAAMPLKAKLQAKADDLDVQAAWQAYLQTLPPEVKQYEIVHHQSRLPVLDNLDGGLLFESRLLDFMEKGETAVPKKALKKFLKAVGI
ncbi:CRISPR-associated RAMP Cmr2, partial [hydrothermal vent metagenome]